MHHITICICTYRRVEYLYQLLLGLGAIYTERLFSYSAVVVDNDANQSAKKTVLMAQNTLNYKIRYICEPERNISMARNSAIRNTDSDYIAFIDDDEVPSTKWLIHLYRTLVDLNADGVLAPVISRFTVPPSRWLSKSRLCERETFPTGTILNNYMHTRTGNVLFKMSLFTDNTAFDPAYGRTGGEDVTFFKKMINKGYKFAWCNEAIVYEHVPPERQKIGYYIKRAILRGYVKSTHERRMLYILKSILAIISYIVIIPIITLVSYPISVRFIVKIVNHIGYILGTLGIEVSSSNRFPGSAQQI